MKRIVYIRGKYDSLYLIGIILMTIVIVQLVYLGIRTYVYIRNGNEMVKHTSRYEQSGAGGPKILILGDSLAYGVGASNPTLSFAGQIGSRFKDSSVTNRARIGETVGTLRESMQELVENDYDQIYLIIGGNDISHYSVDISKSQRDLNEVTTELSRRSKKLYLYTPIKFDKVGAIPYFFGDYYAQRSEKIRDTAIDISKKLTSVYYVDPQGVSQQRYINYQASDRFHLNDQGIQALVDLTFSEKM